jgi:hypothetical protein
MAAADLYENGNWARKGCISPDLPAVCCCRKLKGGDENLLYNKKLADETLTSLSTGSNSTSQGYSVGLLLSVRNYRALVYM